MLLWTSRASVGNDAAQQSTVIDVRQLSTALSDRLSSLGGGLGDTGTAAHGDDGRTECTASRFVPAALADQCGEPRCVAATHAMGRKQTCAKGDQCDQSYVPLPPHHNRLSSVAMCDKSAAAQPRAFALHTTQVHKGGRTGDMLPRWSVQRSRNAVKCTTREDPSTHGHAHCPLCMDSFHCWQLAVTLPCRHVLHPLCLREWLIAAAGRGTCATCPDCQNPIVRSALERRQSHSGTHKRGIALCHRSKRADRSKGAVKLRPALFTGRTPSASLAHESSTSVPYGVYAMPDFSAGSVPRGGYGATKRSRQCCGACDIM